MIRSTRRQEEVAANLVVNTHASSTFAATTSVQVVTHTMRLISCLVHSLFITRTSCCSYNFARKEIFSFKNCSPCVLFREEGESILLPDTSSRNSLSESKRDSRSERKLSAYIMPPFVLLPASRFTRI